MVEPRTARHPTAGLLLRLGASLHGPAGRPYGPDTGGRRTAAAAAAAADAAAAGFLSFAPRACRARASPTTRISSSRPRPSSSPRSKRRSLAMSLGVGLSGERTGRHRRGSVQSVFVGTGRGAWGPESVHASLGHAMGYAARFRWRPCGGALARGRAGREGVVGAGLVQGWWRACKRVNRL